MEPWQEVCGKCWSAKKRQLDTWSDEDPIGKKRQRLVRWLMSRQGVSLEKAKLIAARKYPR